MKITELRCAVIGHAPVVRIITDSGVSGYGPVESSKPYLKPVIELYEQYIVGEDPTDVERVLLKIRRFAGFKPWGSAVSAIEIALWDIAGKAAGLPVHKLLGGKVRDRVRVYNGGVRPAMTGHTPQDYAAAMRQMKAAQQGFTLIKQALAYHGPLSLQFPAGFYGEPRSGPSHPNRGLMNERGMDYVVSCVEAMKEVLGNEVGLALDLGPGWTVPDAIRLARSLEPLNLVWLEDMLTGDYVPYVNARQYRELTSNTTTPIHTGEQIYLRQNFVELIETHAVRVIGPDPLDVGGIAELKWIAEYADLHGILVAPHGVNDGLIGLAALVQLCATLPDNYVAFEYPLGKPEWWYSIVDGLPDPIVVDGFVEVGNRPGLGIEFKVNEASEYLSASDSGFFD